MEVNKATKEMLEIRRKTVWVGVRVREGEGVGWGGEEVRC